MHRKPSLGALAAAVGGEVRGDAEVPVRGLRALERAGPEDLAFYTSVAYRARLAGSRAGAVLTSPKLAPDVVGELGEGRPLLLVVDPQLALVALLERFHPAEAPPAGIHPTAIVDGAEIDPSAHVGPYAVVGAGSRVAAGAVVGTHAVVGRGCLVGDGTVLHPHVVLYDRTELGARVTVHAGTVLGADGFGYASRGGGHVKVPQVGRTVIEDDVEIGALSAVDRALLEETRVGAGTKIDNLVQVGHNVEIGRASLLCGQAGIAGSARMGDGVVVAGQAGVGGHLEVGHGVQVAAKAALLHSVGDGEKVGGIPAFDLGRWRRAVAMLPRLGELARRVRALEKRLERADRGKEA